MKNKTIFSSPKLAVIFMLVSMSVSLRAQVFPNPGIEISPLVPISSAIESHMSDLDGDGDLDVIDIFSGQFGWYENLDGLGTYGPSQSINTSISYSSDIQTADLDGDGDMDIIGTSQGLSVIYWYENTNSLGSFGPPQVIISGEYGTNSLFPADLDDDGDMDVLSASFLSDKIAWYENDGSGNFGPQQVIFAASNDMLDVYAADLDGDGDLDVLSASSTDDRIAWYENDGLGNFGPQQTVTTQADGAAVVYAVDMDGDQDFDILAASKDDDKITWYENTDGLGTFGPLQNIPFVNGNQLRDIFPADIDGDGDVDVVSASHGNTALVAWHENTDCMGTFLSHEVISNSSYSWGARVISSGDIDLDGDMDVLVSHEAASHISWHENTSALVPQINLPEIMYACHGNFEEFCGPASVGCNTLNFNWYFNDPNTQTPVPVTNSNPNDQCYTPDQYGSYTLIVEDNNGIITDYNILVLEEIPQPTLGMFNTLCIGEVISIAGQGFDSAAYEINWYHNGTLVQQGGTTLYGQFTSGIIEVEIFHIECNETVSAIAKIKDCCANIPEPVLGTGGVICVGDTISIAGQGFDNAYFEVTWFHNGNIVQQGGTTLIPQFASGTITVEVLHIICDEVVSDSLKIKKCCPDEIPQPILGSGGILCSGELITIAGQGFGTAAYEITWFHNGNVVQQGGTTLTSSYTSGTITVEILHIGCNETVSASAAIKICCPDEIPQPVLGSGGVICQGDIISIAGQGFEANGYQITWFHNGTVVQQGGTTLLMSFVSGTITVQITHDGCDEVVSATAKIKVCGKHENTKRTLSASDINQEGGFVSVFPNPTVNEVELKTSFRTGTYQVSDVQGKVIKRGSIHASQARIDFAIYNSGLYFVQILSDSGEVHFKKVIKE